MRLCPRRLQRRSLWPSLRPRKRPRQSQPSEEERRPRSKPKRGAVPDEVREKFTQLGNKYHFKDGTLAFTDRGKRLTSPSENTEVIKSMVAVAHARGWGEITVSGT